MDFKLKKGINGPLEQLLSNPLDFFHKVEEYPLNGYPVELLGATGSSFVYRVSDAHAAKVRVDLQLETFHERVLREHVIQTILYEKGISVPEPIGIFKFDPGHFPELSFYSSRQSLFQVMEFINGLDSYYLGCSSKEEVYAIVCEELAKARELGLEVHDHFGTHNSMVRNDGRVYLIDFGEWRFK